MYSAAPGTIESREKLKISLPVVAAAVLLGIVQSLRVFDPSLSAVARQTALIAGLGLAFYTLILYVAVTGAIQDRHILQGIIAVINGLLMVCTFTFQEALLPQFSLILHTIILLATAVLFGRVLAYAYLGIAWVGGLALSLSQQQFLPVDWGMAFLLLGISVAVVEELMRLLDALSQEIQRLSLLNRITRSLASSIEPNQVMALLNTSLQSALPADTYYVGTLQDGHLRMDLFYDDGVFYPPQDVPLAGTMAGWVALNKKPLWVGDAEKDPLPNGIEHVLMGAPKGSRAWIGVPLDAGGHSLGMIGVASYRPNVFTDKDFDLLQNLAQQAAMALTNAFHHAEITEQSRTDSLTGILNHRSFLDSLESSLSEAAANTRPLSLIMMDIDFFKQYNDNYGHLVGDQVLILFTQVIRDHVKVSDLFGRWGGEEFVLALPGAHGAQAGQVAERIRVALQAAIAFDSEGKPVPPPTISQGIAVFPDEAQDVRELIHLADQRQYLAKEKGRDQIEPSLSDWGHTEVTEAVAAPAVDELLASSSTILRA
jgi:diguanylate cyclase (GGDEF)-like protein